jgi:PTH1 family peptidyl-tRNA hydrolase
VQSVIDSLGTDQFNRLRIGVGRPSQTQGGLLGVEGWVLQPFNESQEEVDKLIKRAAEVVENWFKQF